MATNTLTLYNAVGILTNLIDTTDEVRRCDNCGDELKGDTWNICTGPVAPEGTPGIPDHHQGHTACNKCAMDPLAYIAEGGACRPCLSSLGGRRSSVVRAGVALRPPVKNVLANKMIGCCTAAKEKVTQAQDAQDTERRQEGADRRAAAVEEVRLRQVEREAETDRLRQEAESAHAEAERAKKRAEEDARLANEKIQEDARLAQEKIQEDQRLAQEKIQEDRRAAQERMQEEADAFAARLTRDNATTDAGTTRTGTGGGGRKRRVQSQEHIERRREAARATRDETKRKLEQHDFLLQRNEILSRQIAKARGIARNWIVRSLTENTSWDLELITETADLMENDIQDELDKIENKEEGEGEEEAGVAVD